LIWVTLGATLIAVSALAFRGWTRRNLQLLIRIWGRVPLILAGVRVDLHGKEHLEAPGPKLFLFNHVSTLDLFLLAAYAPPSPCVAYKKEFRRIPGIGWALIALGMIEIDRSDAERAIESLSRAGDRLQAEKLTLMMAPEGTRSRRGGLQQFKKGPFHVAIATRAPIYPIIWRGNETLNPMGSWLIRSGEIRADSLAPMDTSGWETETIALHISDTRAVFLRYLPPERVSDADSSS
jgi:putative phosphoserine phosphatase/1-acylglycerol-3-phosphate O-acyltransferase